jgi:hypothetical protein
VCNAVRSFKHIRYSSDKVQYHGTIPGRVVCLLFLERALLVPLLLVIRATGSLSFYRGCPLLPLCQAITIFAIMDRASQALAAAFSADQPGTYRSVAEKCNVPRSTLHRRKHGGTSKEVKAQRQQYLTVEEERALVSFLLLMSSLGQPVRIKYIPTLAFSIARRRSTTNKRRGCAQPQVPRPHLINYIRDDCVRCAGSLTASRSSDPRCDRA